MVGCLDGWRVEQANGEHARWPDGQQARRQGVRGVDRADRPAGRRAHTRIGWPPISQNLPAASMSGGALLAAGDFPPSGGPPPVGLPVTGLLPRPSATGCRRSGADERLDASVGPKAVASGKRQCRNGQGPSFFERPERGNKFEAFAVEFRLFTQATVLRCLLVALVASEAHGSGKGLE